MARENLADCYIHLGKLDEAKKIIGSKSSSLKDLQRQRFILARHPNDPNALELKKNLISRINRLLADHDGLMLREFAEYLEEMGEFEEANSLWNKIIQSTPLDIDGQHFAFASEDIYPHAAESMRRMKNYARAISLYEEARNRLRRKYPNQPYLFKNSYLRALADAYFHTGNFVRAIESLQEIATPTPDDLQKIKSYQDQTRLSSQSSTSSLATSVSDLQSTKKRNADSLDEKEDPKAEKLENNKKLKTSPENKTNAHSSVLDLD